MCRDAELIRLVVLDGTKVKANASLEANRGAATLDEQVRQMLAEAESTDKCKDRSFGPGGRERFPRALSRREDRQARLAAAAADAGAWSEKNAASRTEDCALFIATCQDRTLRAELAELREAALPRGRMPKGLSARQRLQRTLRTTRDLIMYAKHGASVEPVIGQMKDRQGAGQVCMRGLRRVLGRVACACRRAHAAHAAPGVCPVRRGRRSDGRKAEK